MKGLEHGCGLDGQRREGVLTGKGYKAENGERHHGVHDLLLCVESEQGKSRGNLQALNFYYEQWVKMTLPWGPLQGPSREEEHSEGARGRRYPAESKETAKVGIYLGAGGPRHRVGGTVV